jgi:anti-sigma factor RsiW
MVSETDIELLESYLDDALASGEVEALRARLTSEPALVLALEQLRRERAARRSYFAALEPADEDANAFAATVLAKTRAAATRSSRSVFPWPLRYLAAAAACVALGFFARGLFDKPAATDTAINPKPGVDVQRVDTYVVTLRDESQRVIGVQRFDSLEKAQEFAADLARWQARSERLASGRFVIHADKF